MIKDKWNKMRLTQQIGNIGSEAFRMMSSKDKNSFLRTLKLIDLTIEDKRWRGRLFEVLRLREIICDFYFNKGVYRVSEENLKKYFIPFAMYEKRY